MPFQIILLKVHYASDIVFCGSITLITIVLIGKYMTLVLVHLRIHVRPTEFRAKKQYIFASIDFYEILYNSRLYTTLNVQTPFKDVRYPDQGVFAR